MKKPTKPKKRKNQTDSTLRNVRAVNKKVRELEGRLDWMDAVIRNLCATVEKLFKKEDNPSIDPIEYDKKLAGLPAAIRKALRDGDWDAVVGADVQKLFKKLEAKKK